MTECYITHYYWQLFCELQLFNKAANREERWGSMQASSLLCYLCKPADQQSTGHNKIFIVCLDNKHSTEFTLPNVTKMVAASGLQVPLILVKELEMTLF